LEGKAGRKWAYRPRGSATPGRRPVVRKLFARFINDDRGQDLIEYALLIGIIAVGVTVVLATIGGQVVAKFQALSDALAK
jgi:Flp pilus assembly pilin Flp